MKTLDSAGFICNACDEVLESFIVLFSDWEEVIVSIEMGAWFFGLVPLL